ncbi:heme biosynthesis HemY N-terminal domain-containing protein [Oceanisphaera avium]|uniref:Heme biosynthesis protein HemY n=1 Tax=Oceanisphaera avium TaxID=1903694 RepID=A0A1Y0CYT1_9GAMM|nr:heme biosynthesis HemY N-terminal domain-containing protein [Oceanisphaera avium]ART80449.1 heme biosynthesis protein HemY [Oceanisphaera avium]
MIRLAIIIAILAAGLIIGPNITGQQGYMLLAFGNYTIETTATVFLVAVVVFYLLLLFIEWLLGRIFGIGYKTRHWFMGRRRKKALNYTQSGMQAMIAEDYVAAEKMLYKGAKGNELALLNYLNAATAAQALGQDEKRDNYLRLAQQHNPDAGLAVGLTQARLQYQEGQYDLALEKVRQLNKEYASQTALLKLQKDVYLATKQWPELMITLNALNKQTLLMDPEYSLLKQQAYEGWFESVATHEGSAGLIALWQDLPRKEKYQAQVLVPLCERLITLGAHQEARRLLLEGIDKDADPRILLCLTKLELSDYHPLLVSLEKRAKKHASAPLHSVLGQLYLKDNKPELAEQHLLLAVSQQATPTDYILLAGLAEQRQDSAQANEYYRQSLGLGSAVVPLVETPEVEVISNEEATAKKIAAQDA